MSRNEVASRSAGSSQQAARAGRSGGRCVDPRAELEFTEILGHRERVSDGSDEAGGGRPDEIAGREEAAAPAVPSMFLRSDMRRGPPCDEPSAETAAPAGNAGGGPAEPATATPRADADAGRPAPLMPEAVAETLARSWARTSSPTGAESWVMQIALPDSGSAELEIERAADGTWHVRVRGDEEERRQPRAQDEMDVRDAGVARDAGRFCIELERWLTENRPELRVFARES